MYIETIRNGNRFIEIARKVGSKKPIVVYRGGKTVSSARAALSHTGALSGIKGVYDGVLRQVGIVESPTIELVLPLGHAIIERPPIKNRKIGIVTMGGSWGVALTDSLEVQGLIVPELGSKLQRKLRALGMPKRASTRNPVDIGASGLCWDADRMVAIGKEIVLSGEVDALVLLGVGRAGRFDHDIPNGLKFFEDAEKKIILGYSCLESAARIPILIGTRYSPLESRVIHYVNENGIRTYDRIYEIAQLLTCLYGYWHARKR